MFGICNTKVDYNMNIICHTISTVVDQITDDNFAYLLTFLLLNTSCPVLANSVNSDQLASGFWRSQLIRTCTVCFSIKNPDQVIWLAEN